MHHEVLERLPSRVAARRELALHAPREAIYGLLFLAFAWGRWEGLFAWVIAALLAVEIWLTIADFLEEDATRRLPRFERALHTVLAVGYGAFLAMFAPELVTWAGRPNAIVATDHGVLSWVLTLYAGPVLLWSVRDALAARNLRRRARIRPTPANRPGKPGRTVLITGGTGFVGSALVHALVAEGTRVVVLTRDAVRAKAELGQGILAVECLDVLPDALPIDAVVNLAGAPIVGARWTARRKLALLNSRLDTTWRVVRLIERLEHKPRVLVNASAVGYYGVRGAASVDETGDPQPIFQSDLCQAWEEAALAAAGLGTRVVALRFGLVLGRDGGIAPALSRAARLGLAARLGRGTQWVSWVHLDDAVGLIRFALETDELHGPVNATAPEAAPQAAFILALAAAYERRVRLTIPALPLRLALGEMAELLLEGQNVVPTRALAAGYSFRYPTLASAVRELAG